MLLDRINQKPLIISRLKEARVGCSVGDKYDGGDSYADDLCLLAPTQRAFKKMIIICEKYATEYHIKFNGSKSKLMVFGKNVQCKPKLNVGGAAVEIVEDMKYLGHCISSVKSEAPVNFIVNDFNCKVNSFFR